MLQGCGQTLKADRRLTEPRNRQRAPTAAGRAVGRLGWCDKATSVGKNRYRYVYCIPIVVNITSL